MGDKNTSELDAVGMDIVGYDGLRGNLSTDEDSVKVNRHNRVFFVKSGFKVSQLGSGSRWYQSMHKTAQIKYQAPGREGAGRGYSTAPLVRVVFGGRPLIRI